MEKMENILFEVCKLSTNLSTLTSSLLFKRNSITNFRCSRSTDISSIDIIEYLIDLVGRDEGKQPTNHKIRNLTAGHKIGA